jgi:hypothetical protein
MIDHSDNMKCSGQSRWSVSVVFVAMILLACQLTFGPGAATAATCAAGKTVDYLEPVRGLPRQHSVPADGHLAFAPKHLLFTGPAPLLVSGNPFEVVVGSDAPKASYRLGWTITLTVTRVDAAGRPVSLIAKKTRRLFARYAFSRRPVRLAASGLVGRGLYRSDIAISRRGGRSVRFRQYSRVVVPRVDVRLHLGQSDYHAGETVGARLENRGTVGITYGPGLQLESWNGAQWAPVPGTPAWFPPSAIELSAGAVGECEPLSLPVELSPGPYRLSKSLAFAGRPLDVRGYFHLD